jgi:hypothetical protein
MGGGPGLCEFPRIVLLGTSVNGGRSLTASRCKHFIKNIAIYLEMGLF